MTPQNVCRLENNKLAKKKLSGAGSSLERSLN